MKVTSNGLQKAFSSVEVKINLFKITREFVITDIAEKQSLKENDEIEIYSDNNTLLFKGIVEFIEQRENNIWVFAGRNQSRYIVDNYIEKTIEFSKGKSFQGFLQNILSKYGIKITGTLSLPKDIVQSVLLGDKLADIIKTKLQDYGVYLVSDAIGNLEIYKAPTAIEGQVFKKGSQGNIISSKYRRDKTIDYDKYIVYSTSAFKLDEKTKMISASVGSGDKVKIKVVNNLTKTDCERIAKASQNKTTKMSFNYSIKVSSDTDIQLNKQYNINDDAYSINEVLHCVGLTYRHNLEEDYIKGYFSKP